MTEFELAGDDSRLVRRVLVLLAALPLSLALFAFLIGEPEDAYGLPYASESSPDSVPQRQCTVRRGKEEPWFPHIPWHASLRPRENPRICIFTTTAAGPEQVLPWLYYHRTLGVELFLIFAEGRAASPENTAALESIPGVRVIPRTKELDLQQAYKPGGNWTSLDYFFGKPCNYELFVRQGLNGETAIRLARALGADWIMHIDTDELVYPSSGPAFSLQQLLRDVPSRYDSVVFPNYESTVERDDVSEPFLEVTLFKKSLEHIPPPVWAKYGKEVMKKNGNYFLTYGNGKSAARMVDNLRCVGSHRFESTSKWLREKMFKDASLLHYSYTRFSDLTSRRKRCHCRPTKQAVKRCFFLDFDREAYIVASTQTEEQMLQWYRDHVVWSDMDQNQKLLRNGMLARLHTPQVIIQGIVSSGLVEATMRAGRALLEKRARQTSASGTNRSTSRTLLAHTAELWQTEHLRS